MEFTRQTTRKNLWQALLSDPNDLRILTQWMEDHERNEGERGALEAVNKAAALPGSWLAAIWTTRALLSEGKLNEAMDIYRKVLTLAPAKSLAVQEISGHLGEAGYYEEALDLLLLIYAPRDHGAYTGFNLFNACEDCGDLDAAQEVLDRMEKGVEEPLLRQIVRIRQEKLEILREMAKTRRDGYLDH